MAENYTQRTAEQTGSADGIPREVSNYYDRNLLKRFLPHFQFLKFAQIRDIPRKSGTNTIKFRRYSNLSTATTPLTEGVTPAGSQLSVTDIVATVQQYGNYITVTDVVTYESPDAVLTEAGEVLGDQAKDTLDELTRDILVAGTTVQYSEDAAGNVATSRAGVDNTITLKQVLKAIRTLYGNYAKKITQIVNPSQNYNTTPINAAFVGMVHQNVVFDLKQLTGWIPIEKYAQKNDIMEGEVGALDEVRFILSENSKVFDDEGSGSTDVYATLIFGRDAYGMTRITGETLRNIIKPLGSAGSADPLDQRATSGWKTTFVAKILNESMMARLETKASS